MAKLKDNTSPNTNSEEIATPDSSKSPKPISIMDLMHSAEAGYGDKATPDAKKACNDLIKRHLKQITEEYECASKYNIVIMNDEGSIVKSDADKIYTAVTKFSDSKPINLILYSRGGFPGSAYLIGKLCLEYSNGNLIVTVPRHAKSAATLICCAAKEIHMGSLSELGPIDPQIDSMPVLGLKNAILHISELVKIFPESSEMFASYLHKSLPLINLGYYERVAESAQQYAEQLLSNHADILPKEIEVISKDLVYKYKDHGFVIDKLEAQKIFGKVIKTNTPEYELGNKIYQSLEFIRTLLGFYKHDFYFIGSLDSEPTITRQSGK